MFDYGGASPAAGRQEMENDRNIDHFPLNMPSINGAKSINDGHGRFRFFVSVCGYDVFVDGSWRLTVAGYLCVFIFHSTRSRIQQSHLIINTKLNYRCGGSYIASCLTSDGS